MAGRNILIVTDDVLTEAMAGPAIRAWQIAEALAADHDVVLATTSPTCERSSARFATESCDAERFDALERWCDVVLFQGYVLNHAPVLRRTGKVMIVDMYDPIHLEALELTRWDPPVERQHNVASSVAILREQLSRGDYFICASEKQRDLWLGFLAAAGRINPSTYDRDPTLRGLIDVVPFGLPDEPPVHTRTSLRGTIPGIGADDEVVIWGGGVYDWLDPLTAIRAIDRLRIQRPSVRLFFMGVRHPNPAIEESRALIEARRLANHLDLQGTHVFFNEGWVPYEERQNFLLEADIGLSLHIDHLETAYSFRTRILDYLWAGLPVVATAGDSFAELIRREGLGISVAAEDVGSVELALSEMLADPDRRQACRDNARQLARRYAWSEVLRPLVTFCANPRRAADHPLLPAGREPGSPSDEGATESGLVQQLRIARSLYRDGGARAVLAGVRRRLRRVTG